MLSSHTRAAHGPCVCSLKAKSDGIDHEKCTFCRLAEECPYCNPPTISSGVSGSEGPESPEEVERSAGEIGNPIVHGSESARRPSLPDVPLDDEDERRFYVKSGLAFARLADGSVRVDHRGAMIALIPAFEWCSAVSAVSLEGGKSHEYSIARYLHLGGGG